MPAASLLALNVDVVVPFIEHLFGFKFLSKDVYQISELPSDLQHGRRRADRVVLVRAQPARDDLPELARGASQSGGGAAL